MKSFEGWLLSAISHFPESFKQAKAKVARCFALSLKKALALNHTCLRLRQTLKTEQIISQMILDWKKLDLVSINEYSSWVCQWQSEFLRAVENEIVSILKKRTTIENWTIWLNSLVQKSINFPMVKHHILTLAT